MNTQFVMLPLLGQTMLLTLAGNAAPEGLVKLLLHERGWMHWV